MSETKFTPGPWIAEPRPHPKTRLRVRAGHATVCQVTALVHQEANQCLIAAAPELYEALKTFVDCQGDYLDVHDKACAVLAKARDEQS